MIKIRYLQAESGANKFGTCNCCGKSSGEDPLMISIKFSYYGHGTLICLCDDCKKKLMEALPPANNSEIPNSSDTISRQAAIDRATKEHDFFRGAVTVSDKARRDELLNVMCWLGELPPAQLSTNLAEVGTDLISRATAQTELQLSARRYTVAHEAHGEGRVVWSEDLISVSDAMDVLRKIPSAQPTFDARDTQYNLPIGTDCISRQQAIEICNHAIDLLKGQFGAGALVAIKESIEELPPAQPEQLEQCPIYGGMCTYPSDKCYDCPRHAGAKMGVTS